MLINQTEELTIAACPNFSAILVHEGNVEETKGGHAPADLVWTGCDTVVPSPAVYRATVMSVHFLSSPGNNYPSFRVDLFFPRGEDFD